MVLARFNERETSISLQFASLYDDQEVFVWSDCLLNLGTDFLVGNVVWAWDAKYLAIAAHFHGLYSSLQLCCEDPRSTSTEEDGCGKEAHQSCLWKERNLLSFYTVFNLVNAAVVCTILQSIQGFEPSSVTTEPRYLKFAPARPPPCLNRLQEGLRRVLACSFEGNHKEVHHQRQTYPLLQSCSTAAWEAGSE